MDLSKQIESEQRRVQERSQIAHLQSQLDEVRHRLEQQAARVQLASEQVRQVQDMFAQLEAKIEAQVGESRLQDQQRARSVQTLQKEVAELRVRVEEPARQLLGLQARVQDLFEEQRVLRGEAAQRQDEARKLGQRNEDLRAQGALREERLARLDNLVGQLLQGEEESKQAMVQLRSEIESERQTFRRQAADLDRLSADLRGEQQEILARLNRQAELQRQSLAGTKSLEERIENQDATFDHQAADLQRIEREAVERDLQGQERLETLRQGFQREWGELREAEERRGESQNAWLRRIEELYHTMDERMLKRDDEAGQMLSGMAGRLDVVEKSIGGLLRALVDLFQGQLEARAQEQLEPTDPPQR